MTVPTVRTHIIDIGCVFCDDDEQIVPITGCFLNLMGDTHAHDTQLVRQLVKELVVFRGQTVTINLYESNGRLKSLVSSSVVYTLPLGAHRQTRPSQGAVVLKWTP